MILLALSEKDAADLDTALLFCYHTARTDPKKGIYSLNPEKQAERLLKIRDRLHDLMNIKDEDESITDKRHMQSHEND